MMMMMMMMMKNFMILHDVGHFGTPMLRSAKNHRQGIEAASTLARKAVGCPRRGWDNLLHSCSYVTHSLLMLTETRMHFKFNR